MKLQDLNIWLKDLFNIIVDLNISLNNAKYLIKEKGSESVENIKGLGFFNHHTYQLKFIVIIQLCKIFDNRANQKRNIHKLFNKLRNEGYDEKFKSLLQKNSDSEIGLKSKTDIIKTINYLEQEIKNEAKIIEKIVTLRDNLYAHYDPNNDSKDAHWNELELIINLSSKCYNELNGKLYNCDTRFEITSDWEIKKVIESFAWYKDLKI
ncbi:MAG: hypothetical protein WAV86_06750 [Lutibacter sp.]